MVYYGGMSTTQADGSPVDHYEKISLKNSAVEQLREISRDMTVDNRGHHVTLSDAVITLVKAYRIHNTTILRVLEGIGHAEEQ